MKKRIMSFLLISVVIALMFCITLNVSADSLYIRKIVSVVYDDSASMFGDNWAYANYAMQAFCGMLNDEDQLYITYMSKVKEDEDYTPEEINLSSGKIQDYIDSIRTHENLSDSSLQTPYGAVTLAFDKLKSVDDSNPNTQYWLVVITDGRFNEHPAGEEKSILNKDFKDFTNTIMPNGTKPKITFLGIGEDADSFAPDKDEKNGIVPYFADTSEGITAEMSKMADTVSGRTRLDNSSIKTVDNYTIQVSSKIPLLNIVVFNQKSKAKVESALHDREADIPVARSAKLEFPEYPDLVGGAYLLGDSKKIIGSGDYQITFSDIVNKEDIVVLFEPALETRMTIALNGQEVDAKDLDEANECDKVSVSFKIYEMDTNKEIDPSLLPPRTKFLITVQEDGNIVEQVEGMNMELLDYELKNVSTKITTAVEIEGFNPINRYVEFYPAEYKPTYTIAATYGADKQSIRYDNISENKNMTLCFAVSVDGVLITDPDEVKALNPKIITSLDGNDGFVSYSPDGQIIFTPNKAKAPSSGSDSFNVTVKCTIEDGTSESIEYSVLVADYEIIGTNAIASVKKTEFYGNKVGASFHVLKKIEGDEIRLEKEHVENNIEISLNESQSHLKTDVTVSNDGTINVVPYTDKEHVLNFKTWWTNWWWYWFELSGDDVVVSINHPYGNGTAAVDVVGEDAKYVLLNVVAPFVLELAILLFLLWWIFTIIAKPRFLPGATLYIGNLTISGSANYHMITNMNEISLRQYNSIWYMLKPTLRSKVHYMGNGLEISAGYGGSIQCNQLWYKGFIYPYRCNVDIQHPDNVKNYINENGNLNINYINPFERDQVAYRETIDNPDATLYYVYTDMENLPVRNGREVIESGIIFAYAIHP